MNRIILAVAVFALSACDPTPDTAPAPLTTATQPMTQQVNGLYISTVNGEDALWATGQHGVVATGSAYEGVVGVGAPGAAGAWFRSGTPPTSTVPQVGIWSTGALKFQDTPAPAANVPISNAVTPGNIIKAAVKFTSDGAGGLVVNSGFNIADVAWDVNAVKITFATPFANTDYIGVVSADQNIVTRFTALTPSTARVTGYLHNNAPSNGDMANLAGVTQAGAYYVMVLGVQ